MGDRSIQVEKNIFSPLCDLIVRSGKFLRKRQSEDPKISYKHDRSIVTEVDHQVALMINQEMSRLFPGDAILNEETCSEIMMPESCWNMERMWMIDPLDSTSSYVNGGQNYGIMIGLIVRGKPELGITFKPARGEIFMARAGMGAYRLMENDQFHNRQRIKVSEERNLKLVVSGGRKNNDLFNLIKKLDNPPVEHRSGALKILDVARGAFTAFVSPVKNVMSMWDTCASQLILTEAGGVLTDLEGNSLNYLKRETTWTKGLIASTPWAHQRILTMLKEH